MVGIMNEKKNKFHSSHKVWKSMQLIQITRDG